MINKKNIYKKDKKEKLFYDIDYQYFKINK